MIIKIIQKNLQKTLIHYLSNFISLIWKNLPRKVENRRKNIAKIKHIISYILILVNNVLKQVVIFMDFQAKEDLEVCIKSNLKTTFLQSKHLIMKKIKFKKQKIIKK